MGDGQPVTFSQWKGPPDERSDVPKRRENPVQAELGRATRPAR